MTAGDKPGAKAAGSLPALALGAGGMLLIEPQNVDGSGVRGRPAGIDRATAERAAVVVAFGAATVRLSEAGSPKGAEPDRVAQQRNALGNEQDQVPRHGDAQHTRFHTSREGPHIDGHQRDRRGQETLVIVMPLDTRSWALAFAGFHYITAITKPQIETLLAGGVLQMALFDESLCEVEQESVRYVLRRNPVRAEEVAATRAGKQASVEVLVQQRNQYLAEHAKAEVGAAEKKVLAKVAQLKAAAWLRVESAGRSLKLVTDEAARTEAARLDGCYAIKTDLPEAAASKQVVHDRYKDLTEVEMAFRTSKTVHLEMLPVHVRAEEHTRGHVLAVMLAFLIRRELSRAWEGLNVTVEEGLAQLATLCSMEVKVEGGASCLRIPTPRDGSSALLKAASVRATEVLPHLETRVVTRKKLPERRKPR